jgi:hypothetical protein
MNICGFEVVRKPTCSFDPNGKGIWPKQALHLGKRYYGGGCRMPWCDLEFAIHDGTLPMGLRELYLANVNDLQGSGFSFCMVLEIAEKFLKYCNRDEQKCELIAEYSPKLALMKGTVHVADDLLVHQGWEPFQIGGGSLLVDGIFAVPHRFPRWHAKLNENGLLTSVEEGLRYISEYQQLAGAGLLEELFPADSYPIEPIEILSVRMF